MNIYAVKLDAGHAAIAGQPKIGTTRDDLFPGCRCHQIEEHVVFYEADDREVVVAEMTVAYKLIRESFTSRVTLDREKLAILVEYLDGPFSRMENQWRFHPVSATGCEVEFFISYEFRSRTLGLLMGAMFDAAFRRFASAFEHRADLVFGRAGTA